MIYQRTWYSPQLQTKHFAHPNNHSKKAGYELEKSSNKTFPKVQPWGM